MRINFMLPTPGHHPVGGYKVVYEYANGLVARGHRVCIGHKMIPAPHGGPLRQWARYVKARLKGDWLPSAWFSMDPRVEMKLLRNDAAWNDTSADVVVATAWETAEVAAQLPQACGRRYYFIQHFEEWSGDRERVLATWRLPLQKIVIAEWLRQIAAGEGQSAHYIPNGVDASAFGMDLPLAERDPHTVIMLYHSFDWKGSADGLAALRLAKAQVPQLRVILFGVPAQPDGLEPWFEYHQLPPQTLLRELYNRAAIFLSPSWAEGWPLPPAEAMLCGAATVLTDIGGHREYGVDGDTTRFGQARNPQSLAAPLVDLLLDSHERIALAERARHFIEQFTWATAVQRFENALQA